VTTIPLDRALLRGSRDQPGHDARMRVKLAPRVSLFGLAPGGACRAAFLTVGAVGSYPTVSALPVLARASHRRSILCGAIPKISLGGRYPPPYPRGARTFLDAKSLAKLRAAAVRPTGVGNIVHPNHS